MHMKHAYCPAGGELCVHRLAANMLKVLTGQDSPHFTFDAVIDMGVPQEGVFAGTCKVARQIEL